MDKEEKYTDIRDKLRNLEAINAGENFVHQLNSRIIEIESEKRKVHEKKYDEGRGGFLKNLFGNKQYPWLIPAAGFTILIFFVFYVTFLSKNASEINPMLSPDKKQETAERNSIPSEQNGIKPNETKGDIESGNNEKDKGTIQNRDNTGITKKDKTEEKNSTAENKIENSDIDNTDKGRYKLKVAITESPEEKSLSDNKLNNAPAEIVTAPGATENNGMISSEEKTDGSAQLNQSVFSGKSVSPEDKKENSMDSKDENESDKKKLDDKLKRIDRISLEKIREEIINK